MSPEPGRRGAPLIVPLLVLLLWSGLRLWAWSAAGPLAATTETGREPVEERVAREVPAAPAPPHAADRPRVALVRDEAARGPKPAWRLNGRSVAGGSVSVAETISAMALAEAAPRAMFAGQADGGAPTSDLAATTVLPPPMPSAMPEGRRGRVWSGDAWLLLRGAPGSPGAPVYGASQAGAVIRLTLSPRATTIAYLRTAAAVAAEDREVATGLSLRPFGALPLHLYAEARVLATGRQTQVQPGVGAVAAIGPLDLPLRLSGRFYGRVGWAGGADPTTLAEGQAQVERAIVLRDQLAVQAGLGLWGGAQWRTARLDAGPSLSVSLPLSSGLYTRAEASWRFRLAGRAAPESGPALVLAASF